MNLELRHLKVVCTIAETGSVTKAASTLGLAQPALTAQLQRIERALGGPLFDRDRRGARPTALGELVLARARVLLPAMKGLQDEAARLAGNGSALTRYRIGSTMGPIVGGLLRRLAEDQPQAQITTYSTWLRDELYEKLAGGRLDFAMLGMCGDSSPSAEFGLAWTAVAVDGVCVMLPESHKAAGADEVALGELADDNWVAAPGDGCFADCFAAACARAGFTPRQVFEIDVRAAIDMVESGAAIGICQPTFRPPPGLVTVPLAGTPLRWRHLVGWHPESGAAGFAHRVVELATESYLDSVARNTRYLDWVADKPRLGVQSPAPVHADERQPAIAS
ncbi:LysR family transcriptional regulator [Catenuloplanes indicus]|uniref:DNA-binding transcriptional LysR family regulator n=1 Tax=Catenuloplanes indicus TaxID=137267 RepID=A0AAE4B281_9ACTN|nr:LysR family transcriptional regulator [Catenuloplanes indicus]MDQ0370381.1 DNA-binding transcriptional LysR family regulator [Catenuloplanes indicus]